MKLVSMKCPSCNANIFISDDQEMCYCNHCGTQIRISDPNNKKYTYTEIDAARIKEAESRENIRKRELDLEERRLNRDRNRLIARTLIIALAILSTAGVIIYIVDLVLVKNVLNINLKYAFGAVGIALFYLIALWITRDN